MAGAVDHPKHYNDNPSGVECIDVVEHMTFNVGNAVKYLWRAGLKGDRVEDLRKAAWYVNREIDEWRRHVQQHTQVLDHGIEVQAPIFVFREWHRHRTQSYNELSARYMELPDLCYVPSIERLMAAKQGAANKQGSQEGLTSGEAQLVQDTLAEAYRSARRSYEVLLRDGVAREIARLAIPVAQYSRMRASANLRNWLAFLTLRQAPNAQWEIRQYANVVGEIVAECFPRTHALFAEGNAHG